MKRGTLIALALLLIVAGQVLGAWQPAGRGAIVHEVVPELADLDRTVDQSVEVLRRQLSGGAADVAGGSARLFASDFTLTEAMIWARHDAAGGVVDTTALWSVNRDANAAASAPGLDNRHHFVNAYLEGFAPFATDNLWVPLYTLSRVKRYAYDHASVTGYRERWQTSREAFYYTRGDCEDHALALADWLIEMGEDARVVLGEYKDEGHAWVALFRDGQVYLMEATEKYRRRGPQQLTLAAMRPSYRPEMMFNRDFFWFNTGPALTVKYDGERWVRKSRYLPPG